MDKERQEFYKKLGNKLKQYRLAIGMTQTEVAKEMGFNNYQTVLYIEKGKQIIQTWHLQLFSRIYHFDTNIFFRELDKPLEKPKVIWRNIDRGKVN